MLLQWGITPLRDNGLACEHLYMVKVFTGMRFRAGTRSRVAFELTGEDDTTGRRELFDGVRQVC